MPPTDVPLDLTPDALKRARASRVLVGFDGFVDRIVEPVAARRGPGVDYSPFGSVAEFAERVAGAGGGRNVNIELVPRFEKLGGNGPILAQALVALGGEVRYVGALGVPEIHPLFEEFARATRAVSLADPGRTTALEFADGKIMLGMAQSLDRVTYATLVDAMGEAGLAQAIAEADVAAFVDWTMMPGFAGILDGILTRILPRLATRDRLFFFDLADPAKRDRDELRAALGLIGRYASQGRVNFGLNANEARQAAAVTGGGLAEGAPLEAFAILLRERLGAEAVLVHKRDRAACADAGGNSCEIDVPLCRTPRVSTGAGDHFNAGYLFGRCAGLSPSAALRTGTTVAKAYVTVGISPGVEG